MAQKIQYITDPVTNLPTAAIIPFNIYKKFKNQIEEELGASPLPLTFPATLRKGRKAQGLSQKDLAKKLKISQVWISRLENGQAEASKKVVKKFAPILGSEGLKYL
jgi:ribosome-binding protein aMBF1 (putative translation factor)